MKLSTTAVAVSAILAATAASAEPVRVVATMPILADMTRNVAGDRAVVTSLVGEMGDPHVFRPSPKDARTIAEADLLVVNGLQLEGWIERLQESAGYNGPVVVASRDIDRIATDGEHADEHAAAHDEHDHAAHDDHAAHEEPEHDHDHAAHGEHDHDHDHAAHEGHEHDHDEAAHGQHDHENHEEHADAHGHHHGAYDPHGWQSLRNGALYATAIADGLIAIDPEGAETYRANLAGYVAEMEALDGKIAATFAKVPEQDRLIVTNHDAFAYFGRDYGLTFVSPVGLSTEAEPSATDMARIITRIRQDGVKAVFLEAASDPRLSRQIAAETDARIGGTLYAGTLSAKDGPAPDYLSMIEHNADTIAAELGPQS